MAWQKFAETEKSDSDQTAVKSSEPVINSVKKPENEETSENDTDESSENDEDPLVNSDCEYSDTQEDV